MKKSWLFLLMVVLAACSSQSTPSFPTPTTIPAYNYVSPTPVPQIATAIATEAATVNAGVDAEAISLGQGRYVALTCGSCHGDKGQGNGDKGPTLIGLTLNEDDFISFLRSGGKLGSAHQYAANRLSEDGAHNLYAYVKSLSS